MCSIASVALITGGASGIGLAVAERLLELDWDVAIVDLQAAKGSYASQLTDGRILLLKADASSYNKQADAFSQVYKKWGRIDFVFANAGIMERADFCAPATETANGVPPRPDTTVIDVDFHGVVWSSYLALHYFRKNASKGGSLVMTSSTAGIYAISEVPLYAAAKHGVLGLARSLGKRMKETGEPIAVNAIIPGTVPTAILPQSVIDAIPDQFLTPASLIVKAIENILNDPLINGQAIECSGNEIVNRPPHPFVNEACEYTAGGGYREKAGQDAVLKFGIDEQK